MTTKLAMETRTGRVRERERENTLLVMQALKMQGESELSLVDPLSCTAHTLTGIRM
jgi:hypothetical protein